MIYICVKIENNNLYLMNIMKYNIFDETKEEKIEKDIRTKESLDIIEDIDIDKFKNYTEINKDSIPLKYEEYLINKQDFEEDNKERDIILNDILEDLNKNIEININQQQEDSKQKAIEEILEILKYNQSDKDIRAEISPFKPMQEPKKISMVGRVFYNSADKDDNNNYVNPDNINDKFNTKIKKIIK